MMYPVSEIFESPQGEGIYTGTIMMFIRLSGCSVGKPYPKEFYVDNGSGNVALPVYTEQCTLYDGRTFACDTDYRVHKRMEDVAIVESIPKGIKHICITGGEPLIHNLEPLLQMLVESGYWIHLETSGTKDVSYKTEINHRLWMTISPKKGVLDTMVARANEIKILVDADFNYNSLPESVKQHPTVFIQPVNGEWHVDARNLKRCVELQKEHPEFRLSLQLHKILSDYLKETVR